MEPAWVQVAVVRSVHPVRRELHLAPDAAHPHALDFDAAWLWLRKADDLPALKHRVVAWKGTEDAPIAVLGPGTPQDLAATLKGWHVVMAAVDIPGPGADGFDVEGWVGYAVLSENGGTLGKVVRTFATAYNAAVQVETPDGKRFSFPAVMAAVLAVDTTAETLTVGDLAPYRVDDED